MTLVLDTAAGFLVTWNLKLETRLMEALEATLLLVYFELLEEAFSSSNCCSSLHYFLACKLKQILVISKIFIRNPLNNYFWFLEYWSDKCFIIFFLALILFCSCALPPQVLGHIMDTNSGISSELVLMLHWYFRSLNLYGLLFYITTNYYMCSFLQN